MALIGLSHVPTSGGLVNPAAEVGALARAAGVPFLPDATRSVGQFPVDVEAIGADMLTGTGRKFLRGPRGTGFLWVRRSMLDRLDLFVAEIGSAVWDRSRGFAWEAGARRFEAWENSYVNVLGLGSSVRQALSLGLGAIGERCMELGERLRSGLDAVPGVRTHDLGPVRCAIVTASVVSTTVSGDTQFDTEVRDVHPLVRLSPHCFTTEAEIEAAVAAVAALARDGG